MFAESPYFYATDAQKALPPVAAVETYAPYRVGHPVDADYGMVPVSSEPVPADRLAPERPMLPSPMERAARGVQRAVLPEPRAAQPRPRSVSPEDDERYLSSRTQSVREKQEALARAMSASSKKSYAQAAEKKSDQLSMEQRKKAVASIRKKLSGEEIKDALVDIRLGNVASALPIIDLDAPDFSMLYEHGGVESFDPEDLSLEELKKLEEVARSKK